MAQLNHKCISQWRTVTVLKYIAKVLVHQERSLVGLSGVHHEQSDSGASSGIVPADLRHRKINQICVTRRIAGKVTSTFGMR